MCPREWFKAKMRKLVYTAFPDLPKEEKARLRPVIGGLMEGSMLAFGKRSAPVLSASAAKRLRRSKAPASAKRPTPKLAERKADWHPP